MVSRGPDIAKLTSQQRGCSSRGKSGYPLGSLDTLRTMGVIPFRVVLLDKEMLHAHMAEKGEGQNATTEDVNTRQPFCFSRTKRPRKW